MKSSRKQQQATLLPALSSSPKRPPQQARCVNCNNNLISVACLTCSQMFCISCVIIHTKQNVTHEVMDTKEAHKWLREQAKLQEVKLRHIIQDFKSNNVEVTTRIDLKYFQEQISRVNSIKETIQGKIKKFFDEVLQQFARYCDTYIEIWGSGDTLKERIQQVQKKLQSFIMSDNQAEISAIEDLFNRQLLQESQRLNKNYEKRRNIGQNESSIPPRMQFDYSIIDKLHLQLQESIQAFDLTIVKDGEIHSQNDINMDSLRISNGSMIPIIPANCPFVFLYDPNTHKYQVGEFDEASSSQLPYYLKTVFIENGDLMLVGGADQNGMPVKTNFIFSAKSCQLTPKEPLPKPKNPGNGLVSHDDHVYVIGGMRVEDEKYQWTKSCEVYSVSKNKWNSMPEMKHRKPQQTVVKFNTYIMAMGMSYKDDFSNIEKYDIIENNWIEIRISRKQLNPFSRAAGFSAVQINHDNIILFGGKQFYTDENGLIKIDNDVCKHIFLFNGDTQKFYNQGQLLLGSGVSFGEFTPIVLNNRVIQFESPLAKICKIHRWYQVVQAIEISSSGQGFNVEMVQLLTSE